ncbi:hypothetical protein GA0061070_10382 [Kosakonia oryziphila]|uniref:Uncharacterized protein n=1 Tax=Kosakonia oryziphila TaxID=1005667 RepID=A0A1C4FKT2_9ENTR|nr:hypothetical protein GA0061070_10382 [Kosakonia oryziphila]
MAPFFMRAGYALQPGGKPPVQPDGGEGLVKRKGVVVRRGLKEAWSKTMT